MPRLHLSVIVRWVVAGVVGIAAFRLLVLGATHETNMGGIVLKLMSGFGLAITACLFVSTEVVGWAVSPIHYFLDAILLPSETLRPPVDYRLARYYLRQMRYDEACAEYLKILHYHPREVAAYVEGIEAANAAKQRTVALKFYRLGMRRLSSKNGERELLVRQLSVERITVPPAGAAADPLPELLDGNQPAPHEIDGDGGQQQRHDL